MLNHIELAKECGATNAPTNSFMVDRLDAVVLTNHQLAAYTNAVIEQVEKELRSKFVGIADVIDVVQDLKVKG